MMEKLQIRTTSHECLVEISAQVQEVVSKSRVADGICYLFVPHTTAGLAINENADPTVRSDIVKTLARLVPWKWDYDHSEGNAAAHIKASLFGQSHSVFVAGGQLQLGTWQGIYFAEFDGPRSRQVWIKVVSV